MKNIFLAIALLLTCAPSGFRQGNPVEKEKFVFLNNGVTVGMIINSVLKADKQRLKLTGAQLPKARQIITDATVKYIEGVKKLKVSGLNQKKLRVLAIAVETEKARNYEGVLSPQQYRLLAANHNKTYPESKL